MPGENELKYVLDDPDGRLEEFLRAHADVAVEDVLQGYLNKDVRIRRFVCARTAEERHVFSFKRKTAGHDDRVEIETPLVAGDFTRLWADAEPKLRKLRCSFAFDGLHWDIDFLKRRLDAPSFGQPARYSYACVAEVEMPIGMKAPERLPEPVSAFLLHEAGRDKGFSSRKLADQAYASRLLRDLRRDAAGRAGPKPAVRRAAPSGLRMAFA